MLRFQDLSADTFTAHWQQRNIREGIVAFPAIGIALLIGKWSGHEAAGAIAAGGAFTTGFAVFYPVLGSRILSMALATLALASATFAGSLSAKWTLAVMLIVAVAGLNYGLLSGLGASAGWIGQQAAVYLVIATYFPNGPRLAAGRAAMILLGGLVQVAVHALFRVRQSSTANSGPANSRPDWQHVVPRARNYRERLAEQIARNSETLSYAARLLTVMVVATAIYRHMHLRNGYWVPMTALLVLKPQWTGTLSRSVARLAGTFAGVLIAYGLAHIPHFPHWLIVVMVMVFAFGCYSMQAVNYALFSLSITLYIVFLFRFGGFSETSAAHLRLLNTAIGGALALLLDSAWFAVDRILPRKLRTSTA